MADDKKNDQFVEPQEVEDGENLETVDGGDFAKEIQDDINQQMQMHFSRLESDVQNVFSQRLETIESHLNNQMTERVLTAQSDILKTNKIFREICRPLGPRWKELFPLLTSGVDSSKVEAEMALLEKKGPLMQAYKSLMSWKELKGTSFDVEDLIPALRSLEMNDVVEKVDSILHRDSKDDLFSLPSLNPEQGATSGMSARVREGIPRIGRSSVPVLRSRTTSGSSIEGSPAPSKDQNSEVGATAQVVAPQAPSAAVASCTAEPTAAEGAVDDRHLLLLAKKIGDVWDKLAKQLKVPQQDVKDILASEGCLNYQGAFRMLWVWRESGSGSIDVLSSALDRFGRPDLIGVLKS